MFAECMEPLKNSCVELAYITDASHYVFTIKGRLWLRKRLKKRKDPQEHLGHISVPVQQVSSQVAASHISNCDYLVHHGYRIQCKLVSR